ncbi:MAG: TonB-dependent receptor domain-containing protein [Longimicrobiales bacterium]
MMGRGSWLRRGAILAATLACVAPAAAQDQYTIFGRVRDAASGQGIAGAQVVVEGTEIGAFSDNNGAYSLRAQLSAGTYTVIASFIGRGSASQQVTLADDRLVNVADILLRETALELEAVVVTGTAAPTAVRALGNSVSQVSGQDLTESPAVTIDQALQGKVAGAFITSNTGTPGGGVSVRLRGTSSITGGAEPLYIVDGVILDNNGDQQINFGYRSNPSNRLADLDPDDIERVEILKGAAAAALYGSRANNGVIQIFTKRGIPGATQVTASTRLSHSELPTRLDFALTPVNLDGTPVERFDHQDLLFRDAWSTDSYGSIAGGSADTRYYLSANWVDQEGIMIGSGHEKLNTRLNLDQRLGEWLDLSAGVNYIRSHTDLVINGEQGGGGLLTAIVFTPTTVDLRERDPETGRFIQQGLIFPNPLTVVNEWRTPQDVDRFVGSLQGRANPIEDLNLEYRFGYDKYDMETALFIPRGPLSPTGSSSSINRRSMLINNDLVGSYAFALGEPMRFTTSAGLNHTYQKAQNLNLAASDLTPLTELVRGAVQSASESLVETVTLGFFGQQQIGWNNRLFLTGALRWDASSTFGEDERWQLYPKVSGSWVVSEEPFFEGFDLPWLAELRLRAALGYAGNQPPLDAAYARFSRYVNTVNVDRLGLLPSGQVGNPELRPERQREIETGFDIAVLDQRLGLGFTYYDQRTEDLLLSRPFSPSSGFASILDNVGVLSNKGIELELNTVNLNRDRFGWTSALIYSKNENVMEDMEGDPLTFGYNNRVAEGHPIGVFYMSAFERDASGNILADTSQACLGCPVRAAAPNYVGSPWPDFQLSLNNEIRFFQNWTASILLDGAFGHKVWNQTRRIMDIFAAGPLYDQLLRGEVTAAERTRIQSIFEAYLEDGDYIKLRDLSVRYNTSADWIRHIGARSLQLELLGRNLYTWTDYTGYDPEVNMFGLSTVARGVDFAVYPNPRTLSLGVRLSY